MKFHKQVHIENRKAKFEYELLETYDAGIQLFGTEIKSIRQNKASIAEAFCQMKNGELFVVNMFIDEYDLGSYANHRPRRDRKLLLQKRELLKIERKLKDAGITIIPLLLYVNEKGLAKLKIAVARGKKLYDKRASIKERDILRDQQRGR